MLLERLRALVPVALMQALSRRMDDLQSVRQTIAPNQ